MRKQRHHDIDDYSHEELQSMMTVAIKDNRIRDYTRYWGADVRKTGRWKNWK